MLTKTINCLDKEVSTEVVVIEKIFDVFDGSKYKRVLLINPQQFPYDLLNITIVKNKRYYAYPPYGLGLLCANLKKRDYDVSIIDLNAQVLEYIHDFEADGFGNEGRNLSSKSISKFWKGVVRNSISKFKPDLVGLTCTFTMSHEITIMVADLIKSIDMDLPIIAGGVHISNASEIFLKEGPSVDFVIRYEADKSFCDFLDFVNGKVSKDNLSQIGTMVNGDYKVIPRRDTPDEEDIEIIPDYLDLEIGDYDKIGEIGTFRNWRPKDTRCSTVLSKRGCRARCSFCSVRNFNGNGVRTRSVESVLDEIQGLVENYGINHITWLDDDLFYDRNRTIKLFNEIVKRNIKITWDASNGVIASAVAVTPELIDSAADSGCIGLYFGIESGNPEILKKIHKPSGVKHYQKVGELMKIYPQILTRGFLIIGFPNETYGQMLDTVNICHQMELDWYTIQLLTPLPSTEIYTEMVDEGLIENDTLNISSEGYTMFSVRESERQRLKELKEQKNSKSFIDFFNRNLDVVPTKTELGDLWFLVDYRVNYEEIVNEKNKEKLQKKYNFLSDITDRMSIENPLSSLYLGVVEHKLGKKKEAKSHFTISREYLNKSTYWKNRFNSINVDHLYNL